MLLGSAATGIGVARLADFICEIGPSPADRPVAVRAGTELVSVPADAGAAAVAFVFKSVADQYVGQVSLFKVLSGTVRSDDRLLNSQTGADERFHGLFHLRGQEHLPTTEIVAGDLGAVAKLSDSPTGSTLAVAGRPVRVEQPAPTNGRYGLGLEPVTQSDDDKLTGALARLGHEDPALLVERTEETHQTVLWGTGDMHLAVALERLARKFSVQVTTTEVRVPYRETVSTPAEAEGRVKKQSGGHGQYAVVNLRVRPAERGVGSQFVDSVVGGAIPRQFVPAVERGVHEAMAHGGAFGFPVVDLIVECFDGKYHSVDSSEMAFRTAAAAGLRDALARAQPLILEPVSHVAVTVPDACQGDVLGDLIARRGRVIFVAALTGVPRELYEAAAIDGASSMRRFQYVSLPLIRGALATVVILLMIGGFNVFTSVLLMIGNDPLHEKQVPLTYMYEQAFSFLDFGYGSAISFLLTLVVFALAALQYVFTQRRVRAAFE